MNKKKKDFSFEKRATEYDDGFEGKLSQKFYNLLLEELKIDHKMTVLDVGCGTGALLKKIANKYEVEGFGIDIEENMIIEAKKKCPEMNLQMSKCEETPFENKTFDILTSCMAYHHFADKKGFAKEAARILKTNGYLYIADVNFPVMIRKIINTILKIHRIAGHFGTSQEIYENFREYGFELIDSIHKGYTQLVILKKSNI